MDQQDLIENAGSDNGEADGRPLLPMPRIDRWQPLRSGLCNVYRYDWQEFWFDHGRLLLRGNNGTGKSRVLALQLPLLLDGEISPARVEPDGDQAKRIEWNLLMNRHEDRLGYTWIEFGRLDPTDGPRFFTLGIGMYAHRGRGAPDRWCFTTSQRIGAQLRLLTDDRHPLTRDRLAEAIGSTGQLYKSAREFRTAIDAALFGLGEHRYNALIELLIQLRKPQLSRELNEQALSDALSEALAPIDPSVLTDVADAFKGLERDREATEAFERAGRAVASFLEHYRRYAQMAARRRSAAVRSEHSGYERTMRALREAERGRLDAAALVEALRQQIELADTSLRHARAKERQLIDSPSMRDAGELDRLRRELREAERQVAERERELDEAKRRLVQIEAAHQAATQRVEQARREVATRHSAAEQAANAARLLRSHFEPAIEPVSETSTADELDSIRRSADERLAEREQALRHLATRHHAWEQADHQRRNATERLQQAQDEVAQASDDEAAAREDVNAATNAAIEAWEIWRTACNELVAPPADDFAPELRGWAEGERKASPLLAAVDKAYGSATGALGRERHRAEARRETLESRAAELRTRIEMLQLGQPAPPPTPHTRDPAARIDRLGAPLWRLIEFRDEIPDADRAGLEAALEAAGLLDAWVSPDGWVEAGSQDAFIDASNHDALDREHLGRLLKPCPIGTDERRGLASADAVDRILARISVRRVAGASFVDAEGRWRNGLLAGRWSKPHVQYIGQAAREAERQRQLAALNAELAEVESSLNVAREQMASLDRRLRDAESDRAAAPSDEPIREAMAAVAAAAKRLAEAHQRREQARVRASDAEAKAKFARRTLEGEASDLGLIDEIDDLRDCSNRLAAYRYRLNDLWQAWQQRLATVETLGIHSAQRDSASDDLQSRETGRSHAVRNRDETQVRCETLQRTRGAAIETILAELDATRAEIGTIEQHQEKLREGLGDAREARAKFEADEKNHVANLERAAEQRAAACAHLRRVTETDLLTVVFGEDAPALDERDSPTAMVQFARQIEKLFPEPADDDATWDRTHNELNHAIKTLEQELLPHDIRPNVGVTDDLWRVTAPFRGLECEMPALQRQLEDELIQRRTYLQQREREVLENTLVGELADHLHKRLRDGERLVHDMNRQIESRPMSTGMSLRFKWALADDGPAGVDEARRRLLGASGAWSPDDREALGGFLQEQINRSRLEDEAGTWEDHLARALDYRRWHRFVVERQQDGRWQRLTKRTHGTGSGGEKAMALTLPMFAAAAAHYASARRQAPRLIMLDEVFAGIDADMRRKCMGLLADFDLDFVMTSEREWACYDTLPGVAIYQLAGAAGYDAVYTSRWVWNGKSRDRDERPAVRFESMSASRAKASDEDGDDDA